MAQESKNSKALKSGSSDLNKKSENVSDKNHELLMQLEDLPQEKNPRGRVLTPEAKKTLAIQAASLTLAGYTKQQICKELKLHDKTVKRLLKSDHAKAFYAEVEDDAKALAKTQLRYALKKGMPKIASKLVDIASEGNVKAIEVSLKALGVFAREDEGKDTGTVNIILPSGTEGDIIEVKNESDD